MAAHLTEAPRTQASLDAAKRLMALIDGVCLDAATQLPPGKAEELALQWLGKAKFQEDDSGIGIVALEAQFFAMHLALFTPSLTGVTPIDRLIRQRKSNFDEEKKIAMAALSGSKLLLLRLLSRASASEILAEDLTTGGLITLFDKDIAAPGIGMSIAARLCTLPNGLHGLIGPRLPLDPAALAVALSFARPGRGVTNSQRCAAALFKHIVRNGGPRITGLNLIPAAEDQHAQGPGHGASEEDCAFDRLAREWAALDTGADPSAASVGAARRLTSFTHFLRAIEFCIAASERSEHHRAEAFSRLAYIQMETFHRRAIAGTGHDKEPLDRIGGALDRAIAERRMPSRARALFDDMRRRLMASNAGAANSGAGHGAKAAELARVLKLIQALRAKTISQGCTEQEAMASASKVAELLDRHGLSLSEVEIRQQACAGIGIDTGRRRRMPLDECVVSIALFCDCKVWTEKAASGDIRYVFFGLPADVHAAHYLYDLIDVTFEAETARFRRGAIHAKTVSGDRRTSVTSFQAGLGRGIFVKLTDLKTERDAANLHASGRDLVPFKASVIEEEMEKLGLEFVAKQTGRKKRVHSDAYEAGHEAGRKFELRAGLEEKTDHAA